MRLIGQNEAAVNRPELKARKKIGERLCVPVCYVCERDRECVSVLCVCVRERERG